MKKLFVFVLSAVLLINLISCQDSKEENTVVDHIELAIIDSLQIDHLGELYLIDLKEDRSEYLLYDVFTNEFLRVDPAGNILQQINRTGDGKDNYQSDYFRTAQYLENGDILIEMFCMQFIYNGEFALKDKRQTNFVPITNRIMGSTVNLPIGDMMFSHAFHTDDSQEEF